MISRLDETVGQVRALLGELGVADNTLIVFTSDNGPHAEGGNDPEFFRSSGELRGIKRDLYEGGIRVPTLAVWPERVAAGKEAPIVSGFQDWFPTFAELADAAVSADLDGISLVPTLTNSGAQAEHDYLYWEFHEQGGKRAIRDGNWKAVQLEMQTSPQPIELYDLSNDLGEADNIAAEHPDVVARLAAQMDAAHQPSADYHFGSNP